MIREADMRRYVDFEDWNNSPSLPFAVTNIVACIPKDSYEDKFRAPTKAEALACKKRLIQFVDMAEPDVIVTLGQVAERFMPKFTLTPTFNLIHPSAILRSEKKGVVLKKQFVMRLSKILGGLS